MVYTEAQKGVTYLFRAEVDTMYITTWTLWEGYENSTTATIYAGSIA